MGLNGLDKIKNVCYSKYVINLVTYIFLSNYVINLITKIYYRRYSNEYNKRSRCNYL